MNHSPPPTASPDDLLLSSAELRALVGSPRTGTQARWLRERGVPVEFGVDGRPRVLRDALRAVMMPSASRKPRPHAGPRLELLAGGAK